MALAILSLASPAFAHNPDTSYARFAVSRESLDSAFTLDVITLLRIVPDLDADGDHHLTPKELSAKAPAVVEFLRQQVSLEVDGVATDFGQSLPTVWPPDAGESIAEKDFHAAKALVTFGFHKQLTHAPEDFEVSFSSFDQLGAAHSVVSMIEQDGRAEEVLFQQIEPNYLYDTGYSSAQPKSSTEESGNRRRSSEASPWGHVPQFFRLGVEHIFLGYDHILFLLSLIIVSRFGELVKIVTAFTIAHTITLILATLEVVHIQREWVEIAIAATIIYTAVENFWIRPGDAACRRRWMLAFGFGLVHGFGFAGVLRELGLPTAGLVRALLSFNVGVEAGQMAIVAALYLPAALLRNWRYGHAAQLVLSAAIALCGLGWLLDRAFGLSIMPA